MYRYAVYFAPPADHPLSRFASGWLGRCPEGRPVDARPRIARFDAERLEQIVAEPARYGFHGTLKPPFRLADGRCERELAERLTDIAAGLAGFLLPPLELRALGRFLALVPQVASPTLAAVATACVTGLDAMRAPPTAAEVERRRRATLDPRQEQLLARWGYPYLLDRFGFHLTLTGPLAEAERALVQAALAPLVAPFCRMPPGEPFRLARRFPLGVPPAS